MPIRVKTPKGVVEFPDGTPESEMQDALAKMDEPAPSGPGVVGRLAKAAITNNPPLDISIGMAKGLGHTALTLGQLATKLPVLPADTREQARKTLAEWEQYVEPSNPWQSFGRGAEQIAEVVYPATKIGQAARFVGSKLPAGLNLASRVGLEAAGGAGLAAAQGGDPTMGAQMGAAGPIVGGVVAPVVKGAASGLAKRAEDMVLRSVKPTVTAMKQQANASRVGLNMTAHRVARFIIDNRLTTPQKAQAIIDGAEKDIAGILKTKNAVTDAPERAIRYLDALEKSAKQQGIPADDVATIRREAEKFMATSPFTKSEPMRDALGNVVVDQTGAPVMTRVLRDDVAADEALRSARASGKWSTKRQWGEQKGAAIEAQKAVERASRDAAKSAVPDLVPVLNREGKAITAKQLLDRMMFREGNRDVLGLTDVMWATSQVSRGHIPVLGAISHWFRNGGALRAGIYSDRLNKALQTNDVKAAVETLALISAAESSQIAPMASHPSTR